MRIVFVITLAEPFGGAQIHVRNLALALNDRGHDVHLIVGTEGRVVEPLVEAGVSVSILKPLVRPIRPLSDVRAFLALRRMIRNIKPDLVSTHSSKAGWLGRLAGRSTNTPTLFTAHGFAFSEGIPTVRRHVYLWAEKVMAGFSDQIVSVSKYDCNLAVKEKVYPPEKIVVIHNGMPDVDVSVRAKPDVDPPRIVMVARFMAPKDHEAVLKALSGLKHLDWTLQFVGDGPLEDGARQLSKDLDLLDRVRFLGTRLDVDRILARAHIFLLITHWEGLNRSTIEALRAGLPCVVSDVGGMNEIISDGVEGYLVPRNDSHLLAERLKTLINNPDLRVRFGKAARQRYEREFQFDTMFEKTLKVYDTLLHRDSLSP